jgi:bifunctional non-homologous end joining protein LigD
MFVLMEVETLGVARSHTQAASDGERGVRLVYYAFDLLHLDGWDVSGLPLIERKALLEPCQTSST